MNKIKTKKIVTGDKSMTELFNNMMGTGNPDLDIIVPKYEAIMSASEAIINVLKSFAETPFAKACLNDFPKAFLEINQFCTKAQAERKLLIAEKNDKVFTGPELNGLNSGNISMENMIKKLNSVYKPEDLSAKYTALKQAGFIRELIMTTKNIRTALKLEKKRSKTDRNCLKEKDHLSSKFITNSDGDSLNLFSFSSLDFKQLYYIDKIILVHNNYILYALHIIYKKLKIIVDTIMAADIDVDKFSEQIMESITSLKKNIPRCDKAFSKIESSLDLLKGNFNNYYKQFVSSRNPSIIMESFISDVSSNNSGDTETIQQFRQIISFYTKNKNHNKMNDPKINKIFDLLNNNMNILEDEIDAKQNGKKPKDPEKEKDPESDSKDKGDKSEVL